MKRSFLMLSVLMGVWLLSPTPQADARGWHNERHGGHHHGGRHHGGHQGGFAVPELDPSAAGSAIVLLLGGMALISSRRRQKDLA
jgi:hypothetical protein